MKYYLKLLLLLCFIMPTASFAYINTPDFSISFDNKFIHPYAKGVVKFDNKFPAENAYYFKVEYPKTRIGIAILVTPVKAGKGNSFDRMQRQQIAGMIDGGSRRVGEAVSRNDKFKTFKQVRQITLNHQKFKYFEKDIPDKATILRAYSAHSKDKILGIEIIAQGNDPSIIIKHLSQLDKALGTLCIKSGPSSCQPNSLKTASLTQTKFPVVYTIDGTKRNPKTGQPMITEYRSDRF